jgi:DNA gyrase subunit A
MENNTNNINTENNTNIENNNDQKIIKLYQEVSESYLTYSISILNRALPSILDGLKNVQRRILYSMWHYNHRHTDKKKKCAGIVGEIMSNYHPHGDSSIYAALVRLTRDYIFLHPLVEGQGNFGSIDGDGPAAMRYTEARLARIAQLLLNEIHEGTTEFQANYDGTSVEPMYLVPQFPVILVNGSQGIAVGYSSNIPSHNLSEVIDAVKLLIHKPEADLHEIMNHIQGPDFASHGIVSNKNDIYDAYNIGEGMIYLRGVAHFEDNNIVITEIPYQLQKNILVAKIIEEVKKDNIEGVSAVRDESSKKIRIVVELKRHIQKEVVLNQIYKLTPLRSSFKINLLVLDKEGVPRLFKLKEILEEFIAFRHVTILKKTTHRLNLAQEKINTLFGFVIALDNIQELLKEVTDSNNIEELKEVFLSKQWCSPTLYNYMLAHNANASTYFTFTLKQIEDIFNLKLTKFTKMEVDLVTKQIQQEIENILKYREILNSKELRNQIIEQELNIIQKQYSIPRRTLVENYSNFEDEDFIPKEEMVITLSNDGFLKRVPLTLYREQKRGGKGSLGFTNKNNIIDFVLQVLVCNSHDKLLIFTEKGKVYNIKTYQIPEGNKTTKGRFILNCIDLDENDMVIKILPWSSSNEKQYIVFATNQGTIRKNPIKDFDELRKNGKIYMKFEDNIEETGEKEEKIINSVISTKVIDVIYCDNEDEIMLFTKLGQAIRFDSTRLRTFNSRSSIGVRGCKLSNKDEVISMICLNKTQIDPLVLTITSDGLGKATVPDVYRKTSRGAKGVKNINLKKNNYVVAVLLVTKSNEEEIGNNLLIMTHDGQMVNCSVDTIRNVGRVAKGVILLKLHTGDFIVSTTKI